MNTDFIKGVVVPILTPIDGEERIDEARLRDQVDYVIKGGVSGILAFGSNGEFYMVEEDEMERGLKIMVDQAAGRVPVYFGIGAIRTQKCCRLAKMAVANGAAGKIYAVFTGEYEIDGDLGYYGNVVWKSPTMIVALDAAGEIVDRQELPETVQLRTGTASPTIQLCASFTQPHLYFIGKTDFSAYEAMRYNYQTGKIDWDYITEEIDADKSGGSIIYGYMGVHPVTEQLWVGKSSYTESNIHVYDVSRSDAVEYASFYQRKASPAGVDFAYRFSEEWINR